MKLYKDGQCMQMVDKDQLQICEEAGWSRIDKVAEQNALELAEKEEAQALKDAKALVEAEEGSDVAPEVVPQSAPKKIAKIKPTPKKK